LNRISLQVVRISIISMSDSHYNEKLDENLIMPI